MKLSAKNYFLPLVVSFLSIVSFVFKVVLVCKVRKKRITCHKLAKAKARVSRNIPVSLTLGMHSQVFC